MKNKCVHASVCRYCHSSEVLKEENICPINNQVECEWYAYLISSKIPSDYNLALDDAKGAVKNINKFGIGNAEIVLLKDDVIAAIEGLRRKG